MKERITRISFNTEKARATVYSSAGCLAVLEGEEAIVLMQAIQSGFAVIDARRKTAKEGNDSAGG